MKKNNDFNDFLIKDCYIEAKPEYTKIKGRKDQIMSLLTCIIKNLRDDAKFTDKDFNKVLELSKLNNEEVKDKAIKKMDEVLSMFFDDMIKEMEKRKNGKNRKY